MLYNKIFLRALHILILNAGVLGSPYQLTKDDYEMTFQVNHLAQFYLTMLLEHVIHNSSNPRIVVVSSEGHRYFIIRYFVLIEIKHKFKHNLCNQTFYTM